MIAIARLLEQLDDIGEKKVWEGDSIAIYDLSIAKSQAIDGLNVIGDPLAEIGLACVRHGCKPVDEIQRDTLHGVGGLIKELAAIAKWCDEIECSIHAKQESTLSVYTKIPIAPETIKA